MSRTQQGAVGRFPFGEPVRRVAQQDRRPKRVFVLGVYASAVHARWLGPDGSTRVSALAVASEPYIFWRGDGTEQILDRIRVPLRAGRLVPTADHLNGPSGRAIDELYLAPLGLSRAEAWLCDLVPHSCANPRQLAALGREYAPRAQSLGLLPATVPPVPEAYTDAVRRGEILEEIRESGADLLILLGDQPIRWFLRFFDPRWQKLAHFGTEPACYGQRHPVRLDGLALEVLPLVHPRQAAGLGQSSASWGVLHRAWCSNPAARKNVPC